MRFRVAIALSAGVAVFVAICWTSIPSASSGPAAGKGEKKKKRVVEQPASVEAYEESTLYPRIPGFVASWEADIGDRVKAQQVLAELFVPEMAEELALKRALVIKARAEVVQAEAATATAEAAFVASKARVEESKAAVAAADADVKRWKAETTRAEELFRKGVYDKQTRDKDFAQLEATEAKRQGAVGKVFSAQALVKEEEAKRQQAKADLLAVQARVPVAEADAERQKILLDYRFIRAPFDGVVTRRNVSRGDFVQPISTPHANRRDALAPLFVVTRTDKMRIRADIPEVDALYTTAGLNVTFQFDALEGQTFTGKIARTSWSLDEKTRTMRIEIDYSNEKQLLRPGMYAQVKFTIDVPDR